VRRLRQGLLAGLVAALVVSAPAFGATRYAAPAGTPSPSCEQASPCDITTAIHGASPGDVQPGAVVIVAPGNYPLNGPLEGTVALTILGPPTGPLPILTQASTKEPALVTASGSNVSRLQLVATSGEHAVFLATGGGIYDDLIVEALASKQQGVVINAGDLLRDSVVSAPASATSVTGVSFSGFGAADLRNDTVEIPGTEGVGVASRGFCILFRFEFPFGCEFGFAPDLVVRNTIARGGLYDLSATGGGEAQTQGRIEVDHSNYRAATSNGGAAVVDHGGNQTAADPSLNADFHELPGSVTIDAGTTDSKNGSAVPDGLPRTLGAGPDIGAFEFPLAPQVTLAAATAITSTSAALNATVNPRGIPATYQFHYGTTSSYGSSAPGAGAALAGGFSATPVSAGISGLAPGTTYHYQLTASNAGGAVSTSDGTFTTLLALKSPPHGLLPPTLGSVSVTNKRFRVAKRSTAILARKAPLGTIFRFTLSAPAKVTIAITRTAPGLRRGHRCLAPTAKLRRRHARHCTRTITVGTLTRSREPAGRDRIPFSGCIGNRPLSPRAYNAVLRASNAAGRSKPVRVSFIIVR
jgi:hypothetical protein